MNVEHLEQTKRDICEGIDTAVTTLRGSVEFRNAVEALLVGTPYEKPARDGYDFEGLYGRLRSALKAGQARPASPAQAGTETSAWQPIETAPKDGNPVLLGSAKWNYPAIGRWMFLAQVFAVNCMPTPDATHWQPLPAPLPDSPAPLADADQPPAEQEREP